MNSLCLSMCVGAFNSVVDPSIKVLRLVLEYVHQQNSSFRDIMPKATSDFSA